MNKALCTFSIALTLVSSGVLCALLVIFLPSSPTSSPKDCNAKLFTSDSVVCVCNSSYCDTVHPYVVSGNTVVSYTTTKSGFRLKKETLAFDSPKSSNNASRITVNINKKYQSIIGFGGAFTDSAGLNIKNLSQEAQENLMRSYFSSEGIEYGLGRIPIASCDFSTRTYTYADHPDDYELKNFSLAMEDFLYKIPLIKKAMELSPKKILLFASSWSAPAWMKNNQNLIGRGSLIGEAGNVFHQTWALYLARFIEAYAEHGINLWGLTAQNEPQAGLIENFPFQCMGFTQEQQRDFIKLDLGPTLQSRGHSSIKLMIGDDQRTVLPEWAETVLSDENVAKFVSGVAVHWYTDWISDPKRLSRTHELFPDFFILGTEACAGAMPWDTEKIQLGNWVRGERYSIDIIQDMNNWVSGWVDWNLALNMEGGPNWVKNFVDAPIIVDPEKDEFYKQPSFYHMGHFSKFVPEGSSRIEVRGPDHIRELMYVGFIHPDGITTTLIVLNSSDDPMRVDIAANERNHVTVTLPEHSIQTYLWMK